MKTSCDHERPESGRKQPPFAEPEKEDAGGKEMRRKVWSLHSFDDEAKRVFAVAEAIAEKQEAKELLCSHVFAACVCVEPDTVRKLLGRAVTRLPEKFAPPCEVRNCPVPECGEDGMAFSGELAVLFSEDFDGSAFAIVRDYVPGRRTGVAEIVFALLMEPDGEISDILLENGFANDAALLETLLRENYINNLREFASAAPKERLAAAVTAGEKFEKFMTEALFGQKKAIAEVSAALTDFWHRGKNGKPQVILLLSRAGGGRSFFADRMQRAFVELGLQAKVEPPLDLSGFVHDEGCDPDLLGDAKSYRNARCGKLYDMARGSRRGMMVFEDIQGGARNAKNILRSFAENLAYDKFYEETMMLPFNVLVFTMKISDDQYLFLRKRGDKTIDAKMMNDLFRPSDRDGISEAFDQSAADAGILWQCADNIVLLEQLTAEELEALAGDRIAGISRRLAADYGIELCCDDRKEFIRMLIESEPHELGPGELADILHKAFRGIWRTINRHPGIRRVRISCTGIPEYRHDPSRRIVRGDYLVHSRREEISDDTLELIFDDLRYTQQERIDCGDYRIEHPKGIVFDDIVGLDDVRDELLDALDYITDRDHCTVKVPAPCLDFILPGPPGNGKTSLAIAMGNIADVPVFFAASSIFTDAAKLAAMFRKAEDMAPAIVVLDEFNSIGDSRNPWKRDAINELLAILDGFREKSKLLVLASTNHLEQIEAAFFRSGRFGRQIRIDLPSAKSRELYIRKFEAEFGISLPDDTREAFVEETDRVSIADLRGVLGYALRRSIRTNTTLDAEALNAALSKFTKNDRYADIGFGRGE